MTRVPAHQRQNAEPVSFQIILNVMAKRTEEAGRATCSATKSVGLRAQQESNRSASWSGHQVSHDVSA